jgi:hypothetical protein
MMKSVTTTTTVVLTTLLVHAVVSAAPLISGIKATFSNPLNNSQTLVTLLSTPRVLAYNNRFDSDTTWTCDLSERDCYHWDEIHDWGTHNLTVTLEGYVTFPATVYQTALYLLPGSCAKVYIDGTLAQTQCGYPRLPGKSQDASHIDWQEIMEATDLEDQYGYNDIQVYSTARSVLNKFSWVSLE